jgi:hypothetical protein
MTEPNENRALTRDERDASPLTRKQAVEMINVIYTALAELPQFQSPWIIAAKDRLIRSITEEPEKVVPRIHVDGGGGSFEALGQKEMAESIRRNQERSAYEFAERRNF